MSFGSGLGLKAANMRTNNPGTNIGLVSVTTTEIHISIRARVKLRVTVSSRPAIGPHEVLRGR